MAPISTKRHTDIRTGEKGKGRTSWRAIGKDGVTVPANRKSKSAMWPVDGDSFWPPTSAAGADGADGADGAAGADVVDVVGGLSAGLRHLGRLRAGQATRQRQSATISDNGRVQGSRAVPVRVFETGD